MAWAPGNLPRGTLRNSRYLVKAMLNHRLLVANKTKSAASAALRAALGHRRMHRTVHNINAQTITTGESAGPRSLERSTVISMGNIAVRSEVATGNRRAIANDRCPMAFQCRTSMRLKPPRIGNGRSSPPKFGCHARVEAAAQVMVLSA